MSARARLITLLGAAALAVTGAARADTSVTFDGEVPASGPDHFFLPFTVPAGTRELVVKHDDRSEANILDFGLYDPSGYHGWGGGTSEDVVINEAAASRAYVRGVTAGAWSVVVGKAKIASPPGQYHVEITFRDAPTLEPQTDRSPYRELTTPLKRERRWYAGDFHVHSRESTDAKPTLDQILAFARSRKLDFVEISDHNTITQLDYFNAAQKRNPDVLLVPGVEYTTYAGHANGIGATRWVDHKIGQPGVTIEEAARLFHSQGAIFSINHPMLELGDLCIGCAWKHKLDPSQIDAVEIGTGGFEQGARLFHTAVIAFWEKQLATGRHVFPVGGSDDHSGGEARGQFASPIGSPTTMVFADELSMSHILLALRDGKTVVKLQGPDDPMVDLRTDFATVGGTEGARSAVFRAWVTGGRGTRLSIVRNGEVIQDVAVDSDPFLHYMDALPPPTGEDRYRAEILVDDHPRTITNHIFLRFNPSGYDAIGARASKGGACSLVFSGNVVGCAVPTVAALALVLVGRRARRATARDPQGGATSARAPPPPRPSQDASRRPTGRGRSS